MINAETDSSRSWVKAKTWLRSTQLIFKRYLIKILVILEVVGCGRWVWALAQEYLCCSLIILTAKCSWLHRHAWPPLLLSCEKIVPMVVVRWIAWLSSDSHFIGIKAFSHGRLAKSNSVVLRIVRLNQDLTSFFSSTCTTCHLSQKLEEFLSENGNQVDSRLYPHWALRPESHLENPIPWQSSEYPKLCAPLPNWSRRAWWLPFLQSYPHPSVRMRAWERATSSIISLPEFLSHNNEYCGSYS